MKKTILTLLFIAFTVTAFTQNGERKEQIKSLKIAFITEKLELTEAEAQKFWPIYNAHELEMEMLRINGREKRRNLNLETLTEEKAVIALQDLMTFENEQHKLREDFIKSLMTAIPAKKIILLKVVEDQFKKRMLEELKKRRKKF